MKKKVVFLFFITAIFFVLLGTAVNAATITELKNKFPSGTYWNHPNGGNNPDGYSTTPCTHHYNCDYYGNCACNSFSNAIQCHGFGLKLGNDYYGQNPRNWSQVYNLNSLKAGDIVRYNNGSYEHTIWVTAVNGNNITFADCNSDGRCKIRWDQVISKASISGRLIYVLSAPYAATDHDPSRSCWRITATEGVNVRSGAGTDYSKTGALAYNTYFYITERKQADGYTWGKTDSGWVVLDYAEHISGPMPELQTDEIEPIHKDNIPHVRNGYCTIQNVSSGKYMNVYAGADANYTAVGVWAYDDSTDQHFRFDHKGDGKYKLYAYCSGRGTNRVVDVNRGTDAPGNGDKVQLWTPDDDTAQLYYIWPVGNDEYVFELASKSGYVIAPNGSGDAASDGAQLVLQRYTGAAHQKWRICDNNGDIRQNNVNYAPGYYTVNTNGTRIVRRTAADPYANVMSGYDINDGETVYVSQVSDFWGYTEHQGIGGWICLDYTKSTVVLDSISIASLPDKTSYFVGEKFESLGLSILANYSNGQSEEITDGFTIDCSLDGIGTKKVTVNYKNKSVTFNIEVQDVSVKQISVQENDLKKIYSVGDEINTAGLSLLIEYNNGEISVIETGFDIDYDFSYPGTKMVTLTYGGKSTSYEVSVLAGTKTSFAEVGTVQSFAGMEILVPIRLNAYGVCDGNMTVSYDSEKLEVLGYELSDELSRRSTLVNTAYSSDKIRVTFAGTDSFDASDEKIIELRFGVRASASGTAAVELSDINLYGADGKRLEVSAKPGAVTIDELVTKAEITNIRSQSVSGRKIVFADVSEDAVVCWLARYEDGELVECSMGQPESGSVELSVSDNGGRIRLMVWNKGMQPLMNAQDIY